MTERKMKIWEPFRELVSMRDDMDRLFGTFFGSNVDNFEKYWKPAIDIEENNGNLIVTAEIPGMTKEDIKVSVHNDVLTISGERKRENEKKEKMFHRIERCYGKFNRSFALPKTVNEEKIEAVFKDGILTLTIPKTEVKKSKDIEFKEK